LSDLYLFAKVYTNLGKDNVLQFAVKIVLVVHQMVNVYAK